MMQLEAMRLPTALARAVRVRAAPLVALEHGAADSRGDPSSALARVLRAGASRLSEIAQPGVSWLGGALIAHRRKLFRYRLRGARLSGAFRRGTLLSFELGDEEAHRTELDFVEGDALGRVRQQGLGLFDERHVLVASGELDAIALRFEPRWRRWGGQLCVHL